MRTSRSVRRTRIAWASGIGGPTAFIGAWVVGGQLKDGYSPVGETISRLAEQGAQTQPLMTAGFLGFGLLMPLFARELGRSLGSPGVRTAVTVSALGTLAVAAFPVTVEGGSTGDSLHYGAAACAYTANVVAPLLASRHLGSPRDCRISQVASAAIAAALVGSLVAEDVTGLLQRTGLTLFDAWAVWLAVRGLRAARG
ncbi:MAG: DUF998 domain-containing protein [Sporichthyaceae bacterium]